MEALLLGSRCLLRDPPARRVDWTADGGSTSLPARRALAAASVRLTIYGIQPPPRRERCVSDVIRKRNSEKRGCRIANHLRLSPVTSTRGTKIQSVNCERAAVAGKLLSKKAKENERSRFWISLPSPPRTDAAHVRSYCRFLCASLPRAGEFLRALLTES